MVVYLIFRVSQATIERVELRLQEQQGHFEAAEREWQELRFEEFKQYRKSFHKLPIIEMELQKAKTEIASLHFQLAAATQAQADCEKTCAVQQKQCDLDQAQKIHAESTLAQTLQELLASQAEVID